MKIPNFHPIKATGEIDNSFVGLKIIGNDIYFYYPESYYFQVENNDYDRRAILNLLRTITIAKSGSKSHSHTFSKNLGKNEFALKSYLWLINDWLQNGFYNSREKYYKLNENGRVNWKRTLKQQPIISNSNIIYNNLIVEVKCDSDSILKEIHRYCIKKSIEYIGWLFNIKTKNIIKNKFSAVLKKKYINVLNETLNRTFDDVKKIRLRHMLNVINGLDDDCDDKIFVYGVDSYHYIFERMVDYVFGTEKDMTLFNPKASWRLIKYNYNEIDSSSMRPDTILISGNRAFILDSKFYRYGYTGLDSDLPHTSDINKQISYGDYLKKLNVGRSLSIKSIYNAFILPYDKVKSPFKSNDDLQYIGYSKTWNNDGESHQYVYAFLVDLRHLVEVWNNKNNIIDINLFISKIDLAIKNNKDLNNLK